MRLRFGPLVVTAVAFACGTATESPAPSSAAGANGASAGRAAGASSGAAGNASGGSGPTSGGAGGRAGSGAAAGGTAAGARGGASASAGRSGGGTGATGGGPEEAGRDSGQAGEPSNDGALGAHPFTPSTPTRGGTMTFTNVGAAGWWPRRIDREAGDPACDYKDGTDTWGSHCCMKQYETTSSTLSPFDEEMTLILKAIEVKQLAVYQPRDASSSYERVTSWDSRTGGENLWFTQQGDGSREFSGDLTKNDCVGYLSQAPLVDCGDGRDYYCPNDPGVLHRGFSGSKLVVFLGSMTFDDTNVKGCNGDDAGKPGPWVAFVASELIRDGGRKWNGLCNCYSKTGSVGDGCGEINVFEVVMDDNDYSNREFASTGVRSFQAGHVGGAVCQSSCDRNAFPNDAEVVDACSKRAFEHGPTLAPGGETDGCPVWRRPEGDRYFFILLDQASREIQVGVVHPASIPAALGAVLPEMPSTIPRSSIDGMLELRLPE